MRAEVVPDEQAAIVDSVHRLRDTVGPSGVVFTSGGIGPTHDDITYGAIAAAFGCKLALHEPTVERMREHYEPQGKELNAARLRMATIPEGSDVLVTPGIWVPLVVLRNVYILPGIPRLFRQMLDAHKEIFTGPECIADFCYTRQGEGDLAKALTEIAGRFPHVNIGSYPSTKDDDDFTTKLTFEGRSGEDVRQVKAAVEEAVPCYE